VVDEEVKYGLAVTGTVHPERLLTNAAARPGDRLILTKPIGTGVLATALKRGWLAEEEIRLLVGVMSALNRAASEAALAVGARCATDVTGFGLLGHASHVARASGVTVELELAALPWLPGARELWLRGARPGGAERNLAFVEPLLDWGGAGEVERGLLVDPQTSGGLLVALPEPAVEDYLARVPGAVVVGRVLAPGPMPIALV
jgi:selenide,water dikinase